MSKTETPECYRGNQGIPGTVATGVGFHRAVRAREYCADAPDGMDVWKYAFPLAANQPAEDIYVRYNTASHCVQWTGVFECARGRHVDVLPWLAANAIVVAAANALYIVDPATPEEFSGFVAPVEIDDLTFDESAQHLFVADSIRIYAFSSDRRFQWNSETLDGYGARFRGCGGRVLAVEIKRLGPDLENSEGPPSVIRLRTEDGTILRSRFRYPYKHQAA